MYGTLLAVALFAPGIHPGDQTYHQGEGKIGSPFFKCKLRRK